MNFADPLYVTGMTEGGVILIGGVYTFKDTHGFPVDIANLTVSEASCSVDWLEFLADAGRQGAGKWLDALNQLRETAPGIYADVTIKFTEMIALTRGENIEDKCAVIHATKMRAGRALFNLLQHLNNQNETTHP